MDVDIKAKEEVIREIVEILGFDLDDLDKIISKNNFYENGKQLLNNSKFSEYYDKTRVLFGKSKADLDKDLTGGNFIQMINGYLNEFGVKVKCISDNKWDKKLKKKIRLSHYQLVVKKALILFI